MYNDETMDRTGLKQYFRWGVASGLCLFSGFLCLSVSLTEIGLGITLLFYLAQQFYGERTFSKERAAKLPLLLPLALYLAWSAISGFFGINPARSVHFFWSDAIKAGTFALLCLAATRHTRHMTIAYLAGACAAALLSMFRFGFRFFTYDHAYFFRSGLSRVTATLHTITHGEVIALVLLLAVALLVVGRWKNQKIMLATAVLLELSLLLNQSRTACAATALALLMMAILLSDARKWVAIFLTAAAVFIIPFSLKTPSFSSIPREASRIIKGISASEVAAGKQTYSADKRLDLWKTGIKIAADHPLAGVGQGNVHEVFDFYHPAPFYTSAGREFGVGNVHNLYIQQLAERGIVGLLILLYLCFSMLWLAWTNFRVRRNPYTLWCLCALPAFFMMNMTETSFQHALPAMAIFLALFLSGNTPDESEGLNERV